LPNYSTLPNNRRGQRGHILIVEQNPGTGNAACRALRKDRFETTIFSQRNHSSQGQFNDYDLVLLEHQQHRQETCLKVLQKLRLVTPVPIVILSDEPNSSARINALESGADDVLSRPYLGRELVARVKAILRRSRLAGQDSRERLLDLNKETQQVSVRGRAVDLTQREFELLCVLASRSGRNVTREEILISVWGADYCGDQRRVDLYVSRIRAKMHEPDHEDLIRSIYGVGYRLEV
jgi:DNA-binding response OmpR family regulator